MAAIFIVECVRCGGLLLASAEQRTRSCPYCGARVELLKAKRLASAENAFEASEILRKIKSQRQSNARRFEPK